MVEYVQMAGIYILFTDYSLRLVTDEAYVGVVILKYLNIDGRICSDGWDIYSFYRLFLKISH